MSIMIRGRFAHSWQLMPLLGFPVGGHLPPEGFPPREVQGIMFRCDPATPGNRKHRIRYRCEVCQKWIPFGRAGQHVKGKEHKDWAHMKSMVNW